MRLSLSPTVSTVSISLSTVSNVSNASPALESFVIPVISVVTIISWVVTFSTTLLKGSRWVSAPVSSSSTPRVHALL